MKKLTSLMLFLFLCAPILIAMPQVYCDAAEGSCPTPIVAIDSVGQDGHVDPTGTQEADGPDLLLDGPNDWPEDEYRDKKE